MRTVTGILVVWMLVSGISAADGESVPVTGETGSFYFESDPTGAEVLVNGSFVGNTPLLYLPDTDLMVPLEIVCKKPGYGTEVSVQKALPHAGTVQSLSFSLDPIADHGRILVAADPSGCLVHLDSTEPLPVPGILDHVSVGVHEMRITKPGYKEYINPEVLVKPGEDTIIGVLLISNQKDDTLVVGTDPPGAEIYVDGLFRGQTRKEFPLVMGSLIDGVHDIRAHLSGYLDEKREIAITQDTSANIRFFLKKADAYPEATRFLVRTDPFGADVLLNGIWAGKTPVTGFLELADIPVSRVNLTLYRQGYHHYSEWIQPAPGETLIIDRKMQKDG